MKNAETELDMKIEHLVVWQKGETVECGFSNWLELADDVEYLINDGAEYIAYVQLYYGSFSVDNTITVKGDIKKQLRFYIDDYCITPIHVYENHQIRFMITRNNHLVKDITANDYKEVFDYVHSIKGGE